MRAAALVALLAGVLHSAPSPRLGEDARIEQPTRGPVVGLLATVTVGDYVEGDVVVLGGDVVVTERGVVRGDVVAVAGTVTVSGVVEGRVVGGSNRGVFAPLASDARGKSRASFGVRLVHIGAWLAMVGAVALILPRPARQAGELLGRRPLRALAAGVLALVVWLAVVGIGLLVKASAAGAGVVIAATSVLVAIKVVGVVAVAFAVGAHLQPLLPTVLRAEAPRAGVGMTLVLLLALLPWAGEVVWLAANIAGIGATVLMGLLEGPALVRHILLPHPKV